MEVVFNSIVFNESTNLELWHFSGKYDARNATLV